jgi:hypothetical protein
VPRADPDVDRLLADHGAEVVETAGRLRSVILDAQPQLTERVRHGWHSINYRDPAAGFLCAIFPTADRVQLVFERGAELPDPHGLLTGSGKQVRMLLFAAGDDVDEEVVGQYLDLAVEVGTALRRR